MVRLKGTPNYLIQIQIAGFNSNMVRLKDIKKEGYDPSFWEFQFQYGAIKSQENEKIVETLMQFQFQYGAIKSCRHTYLRCELICFNSNMVRLKVSSQ